eukprot:1004222-Amorphochlora_amoeboformis.AAC.1
MGWLQRWVGCKDEMGCKDGLQRLVRRLVANITWLGLGNWGDNQLHHLLTFSKLLHHNTHHSIQPFTHLFKATTPQLSSLHQYERLPTSSYLPHHKPIRLSIRPFTHLSKASTPQHSSLHQYEDA